MGTNTVFHVFEEGSERSLEVFIGNDGKINLQAGLLNDPQLEYSGYVLMTKEDALELSEELKRLAEML
jgi:hypothetical protein